jgi:hypothetical protein
VKISRVFPLLVLPFCIASQVYAAAEEDRCCGLLFWIFVCFGALVVLAQVIPAVLLIIGFTRGFPIRHKGDENVKG